jgi:hypothetical protein
MKLDSEGAHMLDIPKDVEGALAFPAAVALAGDCVAVEGERLPVDCGGERDLSREGERDFPRRWGEVITEAWREEAGRLGRGGPIAATV